VKINKKDLIFIQLIILATIFAWHGILGQIIEGEGFIYFSPGYSLISSSGKIVNLLAGFDNFAKVFTFVFERVFGGNLTPYIVVLLMTIILVNVAFYLFVKEATKNRWLAFLAAIYAGINYQAAFQFYARGHFQWFLQRVPELLPIFASFYYLTKYTNSRKTKYYYLSLTLFFLALLMSHYATLFLPFFLAFFMVSAFTQIKDKEKRLKLLLMSVPFVTVNYLLIANTSLSAEVIRPNQTFLQFLSQPKDIISKISHQLVVVTMPWGSFRSLVNTITSYRSLIGKYGPDFLLDLANLFPKRTEDYQALISKTIIPTYLFYIGSIWLLFKKKSKAFTLASASFLALLGVLFLNVYLGRFNVFAEIFQGRYYYLPAFYVGIILASFFNTLFKNKKVLLLIALTWALYNTKLIWRQIHDSQYSFTGGKLMLQHLDERKEYLPEKSIVILPQPLMPLGENFLEKYYTGPETKFLYLDEKWQSKIPENFDPKNLFVFAYNEEYEKGGNASLTKITVIDKSEEFRQILFAPKN